MLERCQRAHAGVAFAAMRSMRRPLLVLLAAGVMAVTALTPAASRGPALEGRLPLVGQLIRVATGESSPAQPAAPAPVPVSAAPDARTDAATRLEPLHHVPDTDPRTWVASTDVLGFGDLPSGWDTAAPAADAPCPGAVSCERHQVRPQRWATSDDGTLEIPWRFNDEGRRNLRAPEGLLESAVRAGMAEWMRWNSNIRFVYEGTTTAAFGAKGPDGSCADGVNTITWARFDPSIIAAVGTCIDPATNTVRDADLALNVTQHWEDITGEPESRHTFDIRSIVTHELGHVLSLLDLYDADSVRQTMMGNAEYGETRKRTLALGDVVGLQTAYPCDADDVCPRGGIVDD